MLPLVGSVPGQWKLAVALREYRTLLRARRGEEDSSLFQQAKERVLLRVKERRAAARVDPRGAFSRTRERWAAARLSLRELKEQQRERLRQYVASAVGASGTLPASSNSSSSSSGSSPLVSSSSLGTRDEAAAALAVAERQQPAAVLGAGGQELDERAAAAAMGSDGVLRHVVVAGIGGACKLFLQAGARTSVVGREHMAAAMERPPGVGLITVSNHVGSIDDPLITSSIVPAGKLLQPERMRWTLCATDRCFKSAALAPFFRAAKVLPVERGAGLSQFGMQLAQSRLVAGEWVHIFPEGTRSRDGRMQPVRKGVGWLVASAAASGGTPPMVLPFVHSGMENILPKGRSLPKLGQELRVLVGEPVPVADLLAEAEAAAWGEQKLQVAIADRVGQALYQLKAQLEGLPLEEVAPQPRAALLTISEDTLLPLIEEEMDSLAHCWHDRWQRVSLPSLTQRMREAVATRRDALRARLAAVGEGGAAAAALQELQPPAEEPDSPAWELAGGVSLPWGSPSATEGAAWEAAAAGPAGATDAALGLLARQNLLRLLRGGSALPAGLRASTGAGGSAAGLLPGGSLLGGGSKADIVAASPLDAVSLAAGSPDAGLLAATADYAALRAQHMRSLLAARPANSSMTAAVPAL
ncbi:phospholipid glycerol acyltransferase family [Micractinium conductrix]|uniref:Phospholipid glycerol acyltransferase family n=1 Tax=Micractinium conductrix TaxID=554055 RepID=A0A2P6VD56_9CHLO|nr:phospholipid glycerol acyltransferase family [Micractinium conductrix]|eukprot:PSC72012.1 phospholipid glycerol acyltransferase family [Micractinium conductrix]